MADIDNIKKQFSSLILAVDGADMAHQLLDVQYLPL
jgi:hypothetical protein